MKLLKIREAMDKGIPLVWNDPEPIEGNDYTITHVDEMEQFDEITEEFGEDGAEEDFILTIQYGGSEAQAYPTEIDYK